MEQIELEKKQPGTDHDPRALALDELRQLVDLTVRAKLNDEEILAPFSFGGTLRKASSRVS